MFVPAPLSTADIATTASARGGNQSPTLASPPHPPAPAGSRIGRVLGLLRGLITHGKHVVDRLTHCTRTRTFTLLAAPFGTTDLRAIFLHITRGLRLAAALHRRLAHRAARGHDLTPSPLRVPAPRNAATSRPNAPRPRPQAAPDDVTLPTPQEIAALLRRPIGVVLTDICRDLGITPGNVEPELWHELQRAIMEYGGSLSRYLIAMNRRTFAALFAPDAQVAPAPRTEAVEIPRSSPPERAGACPRAGLPPDPRGPPPHLPVAA
jgi:hypothetical protein